MDALDNDVPMYKHFYQPASLERLCINCLLSHRDLWIRINDHCLIEERIFARRKAIVYPPAVADHLFQCFLRPLERVTLRDVEIFCDSSRFKLTRIHITVPIEHDAALRLLESHSAVRELVISDCRELRKDFVLKLLERGKKLTLLYLGKVRQMLEDFCKFLESENLFCEDQIDADSSNREASASNSDYGSEDAHPWPSTSESPGNVLAAFLMSVERTTLDTASLDALIRAANFPMLRRFSVHAIPSEFSNNEAFDKLIARFSPTLTHLDLSGSPLIATDVSWLKPLANLRSLILFNCFEQPLDQEAVTVISALSQLRKLDISRCSLDDEDETAIAYDSPSETLSRLVSTLPRLFHLDISGTNLAGQQADIRRRPMNAAQRKSGQDAARAPPDLDAYSIPGLVGRKLDFLGLFGCPHDACRRDRLPARRVAGTHDEAQLLCALTAYRHRADSVRRVLDALFNLYRGGQPVAPALRHDVLHAVLDAMQVHCRDRLVLISGSATLFYLVHNAFADNRDQFDEQDVRTIINCLVASGERFEHDPTLIRNTCLTLCKFRLPDQVMFVYERLVRLLLRVAKQSDIENFPQRVSVFLLNVLACNVDDREKQLLGDLGTVECMLDIICQKLTSRIADDVLDTCWSVLWNITDETPANCSRFIEYNNNSRSGLIVFSQSLEFPNRQELLRNCMGLMGNVAEVKQLRPHLITPNFIERFDRLLFDTSDSIEIAYNSAGVLSNILSDGPEAWRIVKPSREKVSEDLLSVLATWDLHAERNINYRSFEPIMRLVADFQNVAAQAWSIWALCNLTGVYSDKYCHMLKSDESLTKLARVVSNPIVRPDVRRWAEETLQRVIRKVYDSKAPDCVVRELARRWDTASENTAMSDGNNASSNNVAVERLSDDEQYEDANSHL